MHNIQAGDIIVLEKEESTILGWVIGIIGKELQILTSEPFDDNRRYYLESHRVFNEGKVTVAKHHISNLDKALDILDNPNDILNQYKEDE